MKELKDKVILEIKKIYDPEIPVNIYELGLIYKIDIENAKKVNIEMTLTSPNCPVAESLPKMVKDNILKLDELDYDAFPRSAGDYAYQQLDPWKEIQQKCCKLEKSVENIETNSPTYKPLPPDAEILCENSPEQLLDNLIGIGSGLLTE